MLDAGTVSKLVKEYQRAPQDTGSPEVQIALLSERISGLTEHFKQHKHDFHSRKGLLHLVSLRTRLLKYLRRVSIGRYRDLIARLNLRDKW